MTRTLDIRYRIIRSGADFGELYALESGAPTLRMSDDAEIKTSLSGDFAIPEDINWISDEIRPELVIDGASYPLGVFLPATVRQTESEGVRSVHVEAYDRCWKVKDNYTETILHFNAGTGYLTAIKQLLTACGIAVIMETPNSSTLADAREDWSVGTSYLEIINQLLSEINYNPLWFNAQGAAILEPASVPTAEHIDHRLDSGEVKSLLIPAISRQSDIYDAPNVFICLCSNPDKSADLVATAENNNPQSPLSISRRGRRICRVEYLDNIASQAELEAYANRLVDQSLFSGETVVIQTALLPGFGVADVTALHFGDFDGICIERSWSMSLQVGGTMNHTLERVVVNLG